jgi:hypothetical protein
VLPDEPDEKWYACLFASWRDGSHWVGEVRANGSRGIHVLCLAGRGEEFESRVRGDANDRATTVAEGVDFLMTLRAEEVERRMAASGPPSALDAVFVESGDPLEMEARLARRDQASERLGFQSAPNWLPWVTLPFALSGLAWFLPALSPALLSLKIFLAVVGLGLAAGSALLLLESWRARRLRRKTRRA